MKSKPFFLTFITFFAWLVTLLSLESGILIMKSALASDQTQQSQILKQWLSAVGGEERLARIKIIHSLSTVKMLGLEGTWEEWFTDEGYHRQEVDLGGIIKVTMVRTPTHCWYLDHNANIVEQAGKALEDEIRDVYFGTWSHLLPTRIAGKVAVLDPQPEAPQVRVKFYPQGGTPATFTIDADSHLPVCSESTDESGEKMLTYFSNWQSFDGVLVPTICKVFTGAPEDFRLIELKKILFNESLAPDLFNKPEAQTKNVHFAVGRTARNIPLDIQGVHLFLSGQVNDSGPLWFILDTGASMSVIDREVAKKLGCELTGKAIGTGTGEKKVEVNFVQNITFRFPGVELPPQTLAALSLRDNLEVGFGREVAGMLGYDFLKCFVVTIDYENKKLHLYDPQGWEYQGKGREIPIRFLNNKPVCDGRITLPGGKSINCILRFDTGSSVALRFNKSFTEKHKLLSALPRKLNSRGGGIGGDTYNYLGRIAAVQVGDLEFKAPVCSFSQSDEGIGADVSHAGKLGGTIFERCTLILDYERQRIILEPNARFGKPFPGEMCGLSVRSGGRYGALVHCQLRDSGLTSGPGRCEDRRCHHLYRW